MGKQVVHGMKAMPEHRIKLQNVRELAGTEFVGHITTGCNAFWREKVVRDLDTRALVADLSR